MFLESFPQILILVIGLLSLACISWRKLELGIYLIVFFLPIYFLRLEILSIPTTVLELAIYVVFLIWAIKQKTVNKKQLTINFSPLRRGTCLFGRQACLPDRQGLRGGYNSFFIPIFLLLIGTIISTLISSDIRTSLGILKGWFIDPLLLFLIFINCVKTKKQIKNILFAFVFSGIAIGIVSIFYWFIPHLEGITYDMRLRGFYLSPNHLAMALAPILLIAYGFFLNSLIKNYSSKEKIFWAFNFLIISIPLYLTYSYGAWLGIIAGIIFISFWLLKEGDICECRLQIRSSAKIIPIIIIGCLLFAVIFSSQLQAEKFQGIFDERSSLQSRTMIWQASLEILKDNFLFGIGPGNFQKYYLDYQQKFPPYLEWAVPQPHNIFLAFWLQCGLIGLIGFLWIVILFFKKGFEILKKDESLRARLFACILISQMIYFLIHGLIDTPYWKNDLSVMFWIMIGLIVVLDQNNNSKTKTKPNPQFS